MKVNVKKLGSNAVLPTYSRDGDCGLDLTATSKYYDDYGNVCYGTGLAIEIPKGFYGDLCPRSSISKYDLVLANSIGKIDSNYRGELIFKFKRHGEPEITNAQSPHNWLEVWKEYEIGDRVGQLVILPYPKIEFVEVNDLSDTERGDGGFGSSGI